MPSLYPVVNPIPRRLGVGPIDDKAIASLQEYADFVLNDLFFAMSAESQMGEELKKNECIDLIEDAKRDRETNTYLAANNCLDEAREVWIAISEIEQASVEEERDEQEDPVPPELPSPPDPSPPEKKPQGFGTMGWVLIGGAAILLVGAVASASRK